MVAKIKLVMISIPRLNCKFEWLTQRDGWYTCARAARLLGVSRNLIDKLAHRGKIPARRTRGRLLVCVPVIKMWLAQAKPRGAPRKTHEVPDWQKRAISDSKR